MTNKFILKIFRWVPKKYKRKFRKCQEDLRYLSALIKFKVAWPFWENKRIENINIFEQKIYSQNGEDGLIKIIFQKIGLTNKFSVEFGVGDGSEYNSRYLITKQGWQYLQMDGGDNNPATIKKECVTAENINELFKKYEVPEEFDLLSIDIDYNTYWVWKAIAGYKPRLIIVEYNSSFPPNESKAVSYDPQAIWDGTNYFGASLLAFVNLGKDKGYTLVGCDKKGINAFFVRNDLLDDHFVIKSTEELYMPPRFGKKVNGKYIGQPPSNKTFISV